MTNYLIKEDVNRSATATKNGIDTIYVHLIGIWLFLSCCTFPIKIKIIKMVGQFPIKISDIVLLIAFLLCLTFRTKRPTASFSIMMLILLPATFLAITGEAPLFYLVTDFQGFIYIFVGYMCLQSLTEVNQLKILTRYAVTTLWISAIIEFAIIKGKLTYAAPLRSSIDVYGSSNLGRLVTNTQYLALGALSLSIYLLITTKVSRALIFLAMAPAAAIAVLAGTRISIIFIVVPFIYTGFKRRGQISKRKILKVLISFVGALSLYLVYKTLFSSSPSTLSEYAQNLFTRLALITNNRSGITDSSIIYRQSETSHAILGIVNKPIFGYGYGIPYTGSLTSGSSNDWLAVNGNVYVHATYLWLLIKGGLFGFALIIGWIISVIRKKFFLSPYLTSTIWAILISGLVWNFVAGIGESVVFGGLLGLSNCAIVVKNSRNQPANA